MAFEVPPITVIPDGGAAKRSRRSGIQEGQSADVSAASIAPGPLDPGSSLRWRSAAVRGDGGKALR